MFMLVKSLMLTLHRVLQYLPQTALRLVVALIAFHIVVSGQTTGNSSFTSWAYTSVQDNVTELTDIGATATQVTAFDTTLSTMPHMLWSSDGVTVSFEGYYFVFAQGSLSGTNNTKFTCQAYINDATPIPNLQFQVTMKPAGAMESASFGGAALLNVDDVVTLKCSGENAGDDLLVHTAQFLLLGIGY